MRYELFIFLIFINTLSFGQKSEKETKSSNTFKIKVIETTKFDALKNFLLYANSHEFPNMGLQEFSDKSNSLVKELTTIKTNKSNYIDIMWGYYEGLMEVRVEKENGNIFIYISGIAYVSSWGKEEFGKIQKGGKNANWAQKDLYKKIHKLIKDYENQTEINYVTH